MGLKHFAGHFTGGFLPYGSMPQALLLGNEAETNAVEALRQSAHSEWCTELLARGMGKGAIYRL